MTDISLDPSQLTAVAVTAPLPELHEAVVLDDASAPGEAIRCIVPSHSEQAATDPMPWQPYVTAVGFFYPKEGDRALLSYQPDGAPLIVWWVPSSSSPDASIPSFGTPGTILPDDSASAGVSASAARADHKHAIAAAAASTVSGTNAEGTSSSFARADHNHALGAGVVGTSQLATAAKELFPQLAVAGVLKINFGSSEVEFAGGSEQAEKTVTHSLGTTPTSVVITGESLVNGAGQAVSEVGATTFKARIKTVDGTKPAAGTKVKFFWIAAG